MCPLNDNCSCHEDDWTAEPSHMCTDWGLCQVCWLCVGCCAGGDDHPAVPEAVRMAPEDPRSEP